MRNSKIRLGKVLSRGSLALLAANAPKKREIRSGSKFYAWIGGIWAIVIVVWFVVGTLTDDGSLAGLAAVLAFLISAVGLFLLLSEGEDKKYDSPWFEPRRKSKSSIPKTQFDTLLSQPSWIYLV